MSLEIAKQIARTQAQLNAEVHPDWASQGFNWPRAIWMECAEMMDREPWKWWKKAPESDRIQQQIEIIDIFHFALSWCLEMSRHDLDCDIQDVRVNRLCAQKLIDEVPALEIDKQDLNIGNANDPTGLHGQAIENVAHAALRGDCAQTLSETFALMNVYDLDFKTLATQYLSKSALNLFRQAHGYKDGTYIKNWPKPGEEHDIMPIEDNVVLEHILNELPADIQLEQLLPYITQELTARYPGKVPEKVGLDE